MHYDSATFIVVLCANRSQVHVNLINFKTFGFYILTYINGMHCGVVLDYQFMLTLLVKTLPLQ
jgi:hypothetical protein